MASLVDSRPNAPPMVTSHAPDVNPRAHSPPIKTTTNSLSPTTQSHPQAASSLPSTPSLDIPGAFPRDESRASADTSGPAQRQAFPGTSLAPPTTPASRLSAKASSLPSTEKEGVKPGEHYDGVGPLPGSISETSVAKLPDERLESAGEPDRSVRPPAMGSAVVSLPSQETKGVQPREHHDGVGPSPGSNSETLIAKLPDERTGATSEERSGVAAAGAEPASGAVVPPENKASAPYSGLGIGTQVRRVDPQEPASAQKHRDRDNQEVGAEKDSKFKEEGAAAVSGFDPKGEAKAEKYRAAEECTTTKTQEGAGAMPLPVSSGAPPPQRKARSSSDSDASNHKKASVMNKVKGEMKVLLGKASRNKEKVEEGEKLKHGSA